MRGTQAGFDLLVKRAEAAALAIQQNPSVARVIMVLDHWGFDGLNAPVEAIRLAKSYLRIADIQGRRR